MLRFLAVVAAGAVATSALAAPTDLRNRILRPDSIGFKHAVYNTATGKLEPVGSGGVERIGAKFWSVFGDTGYFFPAGNCLQLDPNFGQIDELLMDWMDIPFGSQVGGFKVGYATDASTDPNAVRLTILFQNNAAGFGNNPPLPVDQVAGFFADLPGLPPGWPYQFVGWIVTFDLEIAGLDFTYGDPNTATDIDGDGLADTGYYYGFLGPEGYGDSNYTGPLITEPNDPLMATGAENAFDLYIQDPNQPCLDPNAPFLYDATYWFGGTPFAQWALALYGLAGGGGCPEDIDGDGDVDLADLAALLTNFGLSGSGLAGDIDGDGDVDLADLASLLSAFGTTCP